MIPLYEGYEDNETNITNSIDNTFLVIITILTFIWITTGLLAFITSLICFLLNGTIRDKFLGLIIAIVIGPLYWFYFIFNNNGYCSRNPQESF